MIPRSYRSTTVRLCLLRFAAIAALFTAPAAVAQAQNAGAPLAVTTLAGQPGTPQAINGTGTAARFYAPSGLVLTATGDLIVADAANNIFRRITPAGAVSDYAGTPRDLKDRPINIGSADGTAAAASFFIGRASETGPWSPVEISPGAYDISVGSFTLARDGAGNIYVADTFNNTIRRLGANGVVSTLAGQPGQGGTADGSGNNARFNSPSGVAIDAAGNLYVTDSANNTIRRVTAAGDVTTFAGIAGTFGSTDGTGTAARFSNPSGIVADANGNLFVTDTGNHTIRRITPAGVVTTFAGAAGSAGAADGSGNLARFNNPTAIAIDGAGNLYVCDTGNHTIRRISTAGAVTTIAGATGISGSADGTGNAARFNEPSGIAVDSGGTVYIADKGNHTIRRGTPVSGSGAPTLVVESQPQRQQVTVGSTATFRVVATGTPAPTYQWRRNGENIAGATSATYTKSNVQFADAGFYSVLVTSGTISFSSAAAQLQVFPAGTPIPPIVILAQPTDREVVAGQPVSFAVEVSGAAAPTYQWRRDGAAIPGANSATYNIASVQPAHAGFYTVTITDGADTASTTGATLTVLPASSNAAPAITTQPVAQSIGAGGTASFTVAATGSPAPAFQWHKNGTPIGDGSTGTGSAISGAMTATLTLTGVTAADAGNYSVAITNLAGAATSGAASLTVTAPPPSSRIINLSILTPIATSGDSFTMGFVVGGNTTSGGKPLVIRAAGPSLAALGVAGTLNDPKLELFAGQTKTGENDNWGGSAQLASAMAAVGAFPYTNPTTLDAATAVNITSRDNSVKVAAAGSGTGLVIAEVYDATAEANVTTTTPRLINVSVLKEFGTGFTAGFVIRGATSKTVLIRAVGPGLANVGVPSGFVSDPQLVLFGAGSTRLGENNDWNGTAELTASFNQVGAFMLPSASKDAAMVATLQPGDYTVQVSGVAGATGLGLVEVYEVP